MTADSEVSRDPTEGQAAPPAAPSTPSKSTPSQGISTMPDSTDSNINDAAAPPAAPTPLPARLLPPFLTSLSPRNKSSASTETSRGVALAVSRSPSLSPALTPSPSDEASKCVELGAEGDLLPSVAVAVASSASPSLRANSPNSGGNPSQHPSGSVAPAEAYGSNAEEPEKLSLSMRLGSAMDTSFVEVAREEQEAKARAVKAAEMGSLMRPIDLTGTVQEAAPPGEGVADAGAVPPKDLVGDSQEAGPSTGTAQAAAENAAEPDSSIWAAWTSKAAASSLTFFKQGTSAAAGLGNALRQNPFRIGDTNEGDDTCKPRARSDTQKPSTAAPDSDEDDAHLARSAADALRLGAKTEEQRRRALAQSNAEVPQKRKAAGNKKASKGHPRTHSGAGDLHATGLQGDDAESSKAPSSSVSPALKGLNVIDYEAEPPGQCAPPSSDRLPERRYFVLTQAGKPVFLSHVASRRLARDDAARARMRSLRESKRHRSERRHDTQDEAERAALDQEDLAAERAEEDWRQRDQQEADRDEEESAVQVGVLQALISNYSSQGAKVLESKSIEILEMPAETSRVAYLLKPPLYLAATSTWHDAGRVYADSAAVLKGHLEILHAGLISLISDSQLRRLFSRGHNFDLRRMLEGTDGILSSLVARCQEDFGLGLGVGGGGACIRPTRMDLKLREDLGSCLSLERWENRPLSRVLASTALPWRDSGGGDSRPASPVSSLHSVDSGSSSKQGDAGSNGGRKAPSITDASQKRRSKPDLDPSKINLDFKVPPRPTDLLYLLLLSSDGQLVTMLRPKRLSAYPLDLHLLLNTIAGMSRRSQRESGTVNWIPICLPRFAPQGMVQAHVSWLDGGRDEGHTSGASSRRGSGSWASPTGEDIDRRKAECALVIVTADRESFEEVSTWRDGVVRALTLPPSLLSHLSTSLVQDAPIWPDDLRLPGLRHFILKKKDDLQIVWSEWIEPYAGDEPAVRLARERVRRAYARGRELSVLGAKAGGKKGKRKAAEANGSGSTGGGSSHTTARAAPSDATASAIPAGTESDAQAPAPPQPQASTSPAETDEALAPLPGVTSHYFRTPHEAIYVEAPQSGPSRSTSSNAPGSSKSSAASAAAAAAALPGAPPYEVYVTLGAHVPPSAARRIAREVVKWGFGMGQAQGGAGAGAGAGARGEKWRLWISGRGMVF